MVIPERGDIIWLDFNPQKGREQAGRRPAIVLSPSSYNQKTSLAVCCPITSNIKGYPFEVKLPDGLKVQGAILSDHLKNLDWRQRRAEIIDKVSDTVLEQITSKIKLLIYF